MNNELGPLFGWRPQIPAQGGAGAVISPCGRYRYHLWRTWDPRGSRVLWVMLNPSTADALQDDPTIRRCLGFSMAWGHGGLDVVNLYGLRSADPDELRKGSLDYSVGAANDAHIQSIAGRAGQIVLAWGSHASVAARAKDVIKILNPHRCYALGKNKDGQPKHPLYLRRELTPRPYLSL